jgi:ribosomal protein S18 acetylase RimI-like enzyme
VGSDRGLEAVERLVHLYGSGDVEQRLPALLLPSRWPLAKRSRWNRALAEGRLQRVFLGDMGHAGPGGYLDPDRRGPDGRSFLDVTAGAMLEIIARSSTGPPREGAERVARDLRAVGLLVLRRRPHGGWWDAETKTRTPAPAGAQGWAIEIVYVAPAWRRRGIGRRLTEAAAGLHGVRPGDLLHSLPLTDAGRLLACATAGTRRLPVAG